MFEFITEFDVPFNSIAYVVPLVVFVTVIWLLLMFTLFLALTKIAELSLLSVFTMFKLFIVTPLAFTVKWEFVNV